MSEPVHVNLEPLPYGYDEAIFNGPVSIRLNGGPVVETGGVLICQRCAAMIPWSRSLVHTQSHAGGAIF